MKHFFLTAALLLTASCGTAIGDDQATSDAKPASADPFANAAPDAEPTATTPSAPKPKKTEKATKTEGPGYTQIGGHITLHLDREKTALTLYEDNAYTLIVKREGIVAGTALSNRRFIEVEEADDNAMTFRTLKPGMFWLTFCEKEGDSVARQYVVEITITGDTRPLSTQLKKLYPKASIEAIQVGDSILLRGTVAEAEHVDQIVEIAEQYYPTVLNQLKAPEDQPATTAQTRQRNVPALPQPAHRATQTKQPRPPKAAVPAVRPGTRIRVMMKTTVMEIDWKQVAASKVDLAKAIREFSSDSKQRKGDANGLGSLAVTVPQNVTGGMIQLLTAAKLAKVVSEPNVLTMPGREATLVSGGQIPIVTSKKVQNGKPVLETMYRSIGTTVKLKPKLAPAGRLHLEVEAEHAKRGPGVTSIPGAPEVPDVTTRRLNTAVELNPRQSVVLMETSPLSADDDSKGMMIVISPETIVTPAGGQPMEPWTRGAASNVSAAPPQPVQPAAFAAPQPKQQPGLHESVRELRGEVKALRRDVKRLIELLEKQRVEASTPKVSQAERHILEELKKPVSFEFVETPLAYAMKMISKTHNINVVLDQKALEAEGLSPKTPISHVINGVTLKSCLKIILEPLNLTHAVRGEVLLVTSKQGAHGPMVTKTYPVADLVIPRPGIEPKKQHAPNDKLPPNGPEFKLSPKRAPAADFEKLTELIQSTIDPDSWEDAGGTASLAAYETTLSLVIRQTPEAHEKIADLLEQLRRQQDLQVTLETRVLEEIPQSVRKELGDFDVAAVVEEDQLEALLKVENANPSPKITLFNGQSVRTNTRIRGLPVTLDLQPVISNDRRVVRLKLHARTSANETNTFVNVPDGKLLLVNTGRQFVLIRPQIVIQEEEEELLGLPGDVGHEETE